MKQGDIKIDFNHHQAAHCENGVTSGLLRFYNINLDEAMVFGIGSGLFFSYMPFMKLNELPVISFRPWPGKIFNRINRRLGIRIQRRKFKDPKESMDYLDKNLEKGIPTGCLVGVFHLSYFPKAYRFHFNAHNLVVVGREDGHYLISDPVMPGIEKLSYDDFIKVRFAKGFPPPKGTMYYISEVPSSFDLKKAIVSGIKQTCQDMLHIPVPLFGVKGIRTLSRKMRKWPKTLGPKKASLYLGQVVRMLEEIGTGGAGFRFIYAAFLQQAAQELNQPLLNDLSKEMTLAGDRWREFAIIAGRIFKDRAGQDESYNAAADILMDVADREERIFQQLSKISLA